MEHLGVGARAETGDVNRAGRNAGPCELVHVRPPQVEMRPLSVVAREPARNRDLVVAGIPEGLHDLLTHFPTARPEAWADRGDQVTGIRAKFALHDRDRLGPDPLHGAAPARMHGRHRAGPPITNQDRCAIGNAHAERRRRIIADHPVCFRRRPIPGGPFVRDDDRPPVDLVEEAQLAARHAGEGGNRIPLAVVLAEL